MLQIQMRQFIFIWMMFGVDGSVIVQWTVDSPSPEQEWTPVQHWRQDMQQYADTLQQPLQAQRRSFEDGHGLAKESVL